MYFYIKFNYSDSKSFFFSKIKSPSANAKGLEMVRLPQQNDFRTFCMSEEAEKVYHKLEEIMSI
jgi:hypothetical protein